MKKQPTEGKMWSSSLTNLLEIRIPASLLLFKMVCKLFFRDCHQLPRRILALILAQKTTTEVNVNVKLEDS